MNGAKRAWRRILLTRIQKLGDCVLFVPVVRAFRQALPEAEIHILAGTAVGEAVFQMCPSVDRIVRTQWPAPAGVRAKLREVLKLRAGRYDAVFLSTQETGMAFKVWLAGIPLRAGFGSVRHAGAEYRERFPFLLTHVLEQGDGEHEVTANLQLAALAGGDSAAAEFDLRPGETASAQAAELLREAGLQGAPFACVHPGASSDERAWDAEHFADACDRLVEGGLGVVLIGTGEETERVEIVLGAMKKRGGAASLAGKTTVPVLAAIFARCAVFAGNDSGPMHLAAAMGAPVAAVFVTGDPRVWAPWTPPQRRHLFTLADATPQGLAEAALGLAGDASR
ncbi:MAG: ADP-heptose--LPS heptosyltransferase [Armatimonadota bacterium]|nr:MAG: ADP-heptose--LPS heptosyltransferase [Armatimonadota bacterium]